MASRLSLLRNSVLRSAVDGMPRSPSWTSTRRHYPSSVRIIASTTPGTPLRLSPSIVSSPIHQQIRKSSNMSSQAPHPTLLIPGPIEFDDAVLQSMSHYRYGPFSVPRQLPCALRYIPWAAIAPTPTQNSNNVFVLPNLVRATSVLASSKSLARPCRSSAKSSARPTPTLSHTSSTALAPSAGISSPPTWSRLARMS